MLMNVLIILNGYVNYCILMILIPMIININVFPGYQETMGPLKESAVWVDETIFLNMAFGRKRPMSPASVLQDDPLGLSVEGHE